LILYTAYFFRDASLRFLMPTFYLYVLAAAWLGQQLSMRKFKYWNKTVFALIALNTIAGLAITILFSLPQKHLHKQLAKITSAIEERIEPDAIVIAPMLVNQYLESFGKWKLAEESYFMGNSPMPEGPPPGSGRGPGPGLDPGIMRSLFSFDEKAKNMERYRNKAGEGLSDALLNDLDRWTANKRSIYWVGDKRAILERIPENDRANVVCEIDMGAPPPGAPGLEPREFRRPNRSRRRGEGPDIGGPLGMPPGMAGEGKAVIVKWERIKAVGTSDRH